MTTRRREVDLIVVGGGHAGVEAAWLGAAAGARVALVTLDPSKIGVMSCNPAIGGLAKGQMVREVDALGGLMGLAADATGIQFKMLNTSKGPAVRGPRAQCDKHAYARAVQGMVAGRSLITIVPGAVEDLLVEQAPRGRARVRGVRVGAVAAPGGASIGQALDLVARAVVLTTGTFMRGLMHTGETMVQGGRIGEAPAVGIAGALTRLGFELGRLKTGTPPRLARASINWESLEAQHGDAVPVPFSDLTADEQERGEGRFPALVQVDCRITQTTKQIHDLIRLNLHRAPMYSGQITSSGPRYCPSIEDKVVRFSDRPSHHVFLEPESHESDWVYCNGVSTSLPRDVQEELVRGMPGCGRARILQYGYAVEYDMVRPHQIRASGQTTLVEGLFLAGQINGTSGYEEAAGQGAVAGINAIALLKDREEVVLGRDSSYLGVMMDDLVTKTPVEPYRMFSSRAEHRLLLRADNASDRLTPIGREAGVVDDVRWGVFERRRAERARVEALIDAARVNGEAISQRLKRPGYCVEDLAADLGESWRQGASGAGAPGQGVLATALAERQYEGYIKRQQAEAKRQAQMERRRIPESLRYEDVPGLRNEARAALGRFRPATLGQAGRLEGVSPADLSLVLVAMARGRSGESGALVSG